MIREGTLVAVTAGPWIGRIGLVEAATVDGLAVRLRGPAGSERDVVVVQVGQLEPIDLRALVREARAAA